MFLELPHIQNTSYCFGTHRLCEHEDHDTNFINRNTTFISTVTFVAMVFLFFVTIFINDRMTRSLNTHFQPRYDLTDDVLSAFQICGIVFDTISLEAFNALAILLTEVSLICATTICPRSKFVKPDVMQLQHHRTLL